MLWIIIYLYVVGFFFCCQIGKEMFKNSKVNWVSAVFIAGLLWPVTPIFIIPYLYKGDKIRV